jgi:hypothetical protein
MGFMERQLRVPIDGPLGPWVSVYLDALEVGARALSTRYETWVSFAASPRSTPTGTQPT